MRLAIVVVYMADERHGKLLELHLDRIARHTDVPYTIHGSVNRLLPQFRKLLERRREVALHEYAPTELRGAPEHSHYLEQLVDAALADGATHVAALHADSFPVRNGWAEELEQRAGETFATIEGIGSACLFFPRSFHETLHPRFLLPAEVMESGTFAAFVRTTSPTLHSGVGYGFAAFEAGLSWYSMRETARTDDPNGSSIYDDLIFHLQGAFRLSPRAGEANAGAVEAVGYRKFAGAVAALRALTPPPLRRLARRIAGGALERGLDAPRERWLAAGMSGELERLVADPDGVIESLRAAGRR